MDSILDFEALEILEVRIPTVPNDLQQFQVESNLKLIEYKCEQCDKVTETLVSFFLHKNSIHKTRKSGRKISPKVFFDQPKDSPKTKSNSVKTRSTKTNLKKIKSKKASSTKQSSNTISPAKLSPVKTKSKSLRKPQVIQPLDSQKTVEPNNALTCSECHNVYNTKRDLNRHFRRMHNISEPYSCRFCKKWFKRKSDGIVHERKVHRQLVEQQKPFRCRHCIRGFDTKKFLEQHEAGHSNGELKCRYCDKEFFYASLRTFHETTCHPETMLAVGFECDYCGQVFSRKGSLVAHFSRHVTSIEFICHICAQPFKRNDGLQRHLRNVHGGLLPNNGDQTCPECGLDFVTVKSLKMHIRKIHKPQPEVKVSNARPFRCSTCSKTFTSLKMCQSHERNHEKVFACCYCGKILVNASNLREHEKLHQTKGYTCKICGKSFHQKTGILHHQRDTHSKVKKYKCTLCDRSFKHSTEYHIHKREHEDPTLKKCNICLKEFASRPSLFIHRRNAHPELTKKQF